MKLFFTTLLVAIAATVFAQSNYHEGIVIKNSGDTLRGYIDYREWEQCPTTINFKLRKDDREVQHFDPHVIKEFEINGMETYVTYRGIISMDKTSFPDLPLAADTSKKMDTIFLKQVVKGKYLTLFYQNDKTKTRLFVAENNADPIELKYSQYYEDGTELRVNTRYKNQLIYYVTKYAPDNNKLIQEAGHVDYEESGIETIVSKINGETKVSKSVANGRFFVGAGVNNIRTEVFNSGSSVNATTVSPTATFGIDIFSNPNVQQLIFRAEVSLWYVDAKFPDYSNSRVSQYTASLTPQILFNFYNKENLKFYIDGGWSFNFSAYPKKFNLYGTPIDMASSWSGFPLQVGMMLNKNIDISLKYTGYYSFTRYTYFSIADQMLGVGIKYLIPNK